MFKVSEIVKFTGFCGIIFVLLVGTSLLNLYLTPRISVLCDVYEKRELKSMKFSEENSFFVEPQSNSTTIHEISREDCESQKSQLRVTTLFLVYCLIRLISNKFEGFIGAKIMKSCSVRKAFPGRHFGAALGFPYLTRSLSSSIRISSAPFFLVIIFISTSIAFYPYVKDFAKLCSMVYNAIQRRHYMNNVSLIGALVAIYFYFSTIFMELLDVSFGLYCPTKVFGLPILFPNVNFPLFLFVLHSIILNHHKAMPPIIYEVNNEDMFVQLNRMRCITNKDCPQMSTSYPLDAIPSRTTTIQRRNFEGRIIQIRFLRELDDILPCKISHQVRKVSTLIQPQMNPSYSQTENACPSPTIVEIG